MMNSNREHMDQGFMPSVNHSSSQSKFKIHSAKPKRPRTAYNYFVREERIKILAEFEEKAKKDGININQKRKKKKKTLVSFEEIAKIMGDRWKVLDESSRDKFVTMATEDFKRYQVEKEAYDKCRFLEVSPTDECDPVEMKDGQGRPFENGSVYCDDQKIFALSIDTLKRVDSTTIPVSSRPDIFESLNYSVRNPLERTVLSRCLLEKFPNVVNWSNNPYCLSKQNSWGARYPLLNEYSGSHWPVSTIPNYKGQNTKSYFKRVFRQRFEHVSPPRKTDMKLCKFRSAIFKYTCAQSKSDSKLFTGTAQSANLSRSRANALI